MTDEMRARVREATVRAFVNAAYAEKHSKKSLKDLKANEEKWEDKRVERNK